MSKQMVKSGYGGGALNHGVAALAALASGFLSFAMPDEILARLVAASGLAGIVPAAQPPFGLTAHLGVVAAATIVSFLAVWLLLRALDRIGSKRPAVVAADPAQEMPRARRADAHPDAPLRRPLLAGRDLGEPGEAAAVEGDFAGMEDLAPFSAPLPRFLVAEAAEPRSEPDTFQPEVPAAEPDKERGILELEADDAGTIEELSARLPMPDPAAEEDISRLMERLESGLSRRAPLPAEQEEAAFETRHYEDSLRSEAPAPMPAIDEQTADGPPLAPGAEPSAGDPLSETTAAQPDEAAPAPLQPAGHRLRNAIQGLEKFAARGG